MKINSFEIFIIALVSLCIMLCIFIGSVSMEALGSVLIGSLIGGAIVVGGSRLMDKISKL